MSSTLPNPESSSTADSLSVVHADANRPLVSDQRRLAKRLYLLIPAYALILVASYFAAYALRFDGAIPPPWYFLFQLTLPLVIGLKLLVFWCLGNFRGWWRFVTFSDFVGLVRAAAVATVLLITIDYFLMPAYQIPRSVIAIDCCLTIVLLGGLRSSWRFLREYVSPSFQSNGRARVFVIGAEQGGERLVSELRSNPAVPYRVVGFLDDDSRHWGSRLAGVPFLGTTEDLRELAERHCVEQLLIISNSVTGPKLRSLLDKCHEGSIHVKMIPSVEEMLGGVFQMRIRDVDINDLLRREPVQLNEGIVETMLDDRCVLVTGAGGSIGSEICRQICRVRPNLLVLVERAEGNLFHIEQELISRWPDLKIAPRVADVCDDRQMRAIFDQYHPDVVIHAAAHKHVPLMEHNPGQAIANNVLGTKVLADLAVDFFVKRFVLISTDKAVAPTSVMGATKQLAERYVHALGEESDSQVFVAVRFGNVLASEGSVVPTFQDQIRRGGPITITHPAMERYFMTIPEASQLVLQAAAIGRGGEIFVLEMGKPVRIMDLARDMIRLSGHTTDEIKIEITGMRPGEKLNETLYANDEELLDTEHPRIHACYHRYFPLDEVSKTIEVLQSSIYRDPDEVRAALRSAVPDYCGGSCFESETTDSEENACSLMESTVAEPECIILNSDIRQEAAS